MNPPGTANALISGLLTTKNCHGRSPRDVRRAIESPNTLMYRLTSGSFMIGSCALICCTSDWPISTSCCVDTPQAATDVAMATTRIFALIGVRSSCYKLDFGVGQETFPTPSHHSKIVRLLTLARDLKRRKAREKRGLFVAEGVRVVEELLRSPLEIEGLLTARQLTDAPRGPGLLDAIRSRGVLMEPVSHVEFTSAAETESPQGVIA